MTGRATRKKREINRAKPSKGRTSTRSWINPIGPHQGRVTKPATEDNLRRVFAQHNARAYLRAYQVDRNPEHIFAAVDAYLKFQVRLPDWMLKNLQHAIRERHNRPAGNPKRNTVRDVWVIQTVAARHGGIIPDEVDTDFLAQLARQYGTTVAALKMVLSRTRRALQDPRYNRARAFRRS